MTAVPGNKQQHQQPTLPHKKKQKQDARRRERRVVVAAAAAASQDRVRARPRRGDALCDAAFDLITFQFIIHECPAAAIDAFVAEAARVAAPGGVVCFVDNNPKSKTIQNLPPALFTLMKSTEPVS